MELSVNELLTADVISRISFTKVINTPDPPLITTAPPGQTMEKAPLAPLDPTLAVRIISSNSPLHCIEKPLPS
eukprot:scaffold143269_cov24-Prasinocladus_malaysianus.AAC.1